MNIELAEPMVQAMQLPLVALIILLCLRSRTPSSLLQQQPNQFLRGYEDFNPIHVLALAFVVNLCYLLLKINSSLRAEAIDPEINESFVVVTNTFTSLLFYVASFFWFAIKWRKRGELRNRYTGTVPLRVYTMLASVVFLATLIVYLQLANHPLSTQFPFYSVIYDTVAYLLISYFLLHQFSYEGLDKGIHAHHFLAAGFALWAFLQPLAPLAAIIGVHQQYITLGGFSLSALAKVSILYGFFRYYNKLAEGTMLLQEKERTRLERNVIKMGHLQNLINEISEATTTIDVERTSLSHLTNSVLFKFDYAIFTKIDYVRQKLRYCGSHTAKAEEWQPANWFPTDGITFTQAALDTDVLGEPIVLNSTDDSPLGENLLSVYLRAVRVSDEAVRGVRMVIPVLRLAETPVVPQASWGSDRIIAIIEVGCIETNNEITNVTGFENRGELMIYIDNLAQAYRRLQEEEWDRLVSEKLAEAEDCNGDSPEGYLRSVLQFACDTTQADYGIICLLPRPSVDTEPLLITYGVELQQLEKIKRHVKPFRKGIRQIETGEQPWETLSTVFSTTLRTPSFQFAPIGPEQGVAGALFIFSKRDRYLNQASGFVLDKLSFPIPKVFIEKRFHHAVAELAVPTNALTDPGENIQPMLGTLCHYFGTPYAALWLGEVSSARPKFDPRYSIGNLRYSLEGDVEGKSPPEYKMISLKTPVPDETNQRYWKLGKTGKLASVLHIPLQVEHQQYGFLALFFAEPQEALLSQDQQFLELIAAKFTMTLQMQNLLGAFTDISSSFVRNELGATLQTIANKAVELLNADPVMLFVSNNGVDVFFKDVTYALKEPFLDTTMHMVLNKSDKHVELAELVLQNQTVYFPSQKDYFSFINKHSKWFERSDFREDFWTREQIQSMAAVQLVNKSSKAGAVGVMFINFRRPVTFNNETKKLIQTFASFASGAIENRNIFEKNRQYLLRNLRMTKPIIAEMIAAGALHDAHKTHRGIYAKFYDLLDQIDNPGFRKHLSVTDIRSELQTFDTGMEQLNEHFEKLASTYKPSQELQLQTWNLAELMNEQLNLMELNFRGKYIEVIRNVDEGLSVACDGLLMGHVFYNLLNNAYQAMSERGRLEVRIRKASDADVLVDVIDDGKGINSKIYHLITEPYITDKPDGSGLGLAMSKLTVEQHGGDLTYTSREKRTKFTIRLPFTYKQKLQPA